MTAPLNGQPFLVRATAGPAGRRDKPGRAKQERLRLKWLEWTVVSRRGFFAMVTAAILHGQEPKPNMFGDAEAYERFMG